MNLGIIILAIIQGIAEFLPISSSAHLIIFRDLFNIGSSITEEITLSFDIALHFGTLLAIGIYFFKDFINMIIKGFSKSKSDSENKMLWYLVIATIPAAIAGVFLEDIVDSLIRGNFYVIGSALIVMGIIIYVADKKFDSNRAIKDITIIDAIIIGCSQAFALIPGFSRSGTTIATGRILKLDRESAAKFSFYLSAPVVLGAVISQLLKDNTISLIFGNIDIFLTGILVAFISGLLCISFLLKYLRKNDFKLFMWYRILLGASIIASIIL